MADCMNFPKDWAKFLEDYSFCDHKEYYTNGARLIPTFRVEQMMHHYLRKATEDATEVVHGRWEYTDEIDHDGNLQAHCSCCGAGEKHAPCMVGRVPFCWNCGAKIDGDGNG